MVSQWACMHASMHACMRRGRHKRNARIDVADLQNRTMCDRGFGTFFGEGHHQMPALVRDKSRIDSLIVRGSPGSRRTALEAGWSAIAVQSD